MFEEIKSDSAILVDLVIELSAKLDQIESRLAELCELRKIAEATPPPPVPEVAPVAPLTPPPANVVKCPKCGKELIANHPDNCRC